MSIELLPYDTTRCSLAPNTRTRLPAPLAGRVSGRRLQANRRNARKSTGPRTAAGKKRSSRNALKHGLCAAHACLSSEDKATFNIFIAELQQELQPRTAMQNIIFDQLVNAIWRLRRLPEAQADLFEHELHHAADDPRGQSLAPSQILARRFSDDRSNGFVLMGRYETSLRNGMLRLLRQFESLKKHHATTPYPDGQEPTVPRERAWSEEKERAQRQAFADRAAALKRHEPPRDQSEARIDQALWTCRKQTQSKPRQNRTGASETGKSADFHARRLRNEPNAPPAGKTQRMPAQVGSRNHQALYDTQDP